MRDFSDQVTWVLVADGKKALFLVDRGVGAVPDLRIMEASAIDNPSAREQGAARPGRTNAGHSGNPRRSALQESDYHQLAEDKFAQEIVARLNMSAREDLFDQLVIFAPASTLGEMRAHYGATLKMRIAAEAAKDLTKHPLEEIERQFQSVILSK